MQRYWLSGCELKLLGKLQKQQNSSQFCDTLLQSDGISIPTHGCILAALSPYLSERLLASPPPPLGQRRHLKLHAVKAQTLLKLVALFYSGEVEVNVGVEQSDLLAAAVKFGITDLVEGQKRARVDERCQQRGGCQSFWDSCDGRRGVEDAQVQAEVVERRKSDTLVRATACPPLGAVGKTASVLDRGEGPPEYVSAQNVDPSVALTHQNLNTQDNSNSLHSEPIPSSDDSEFSCLLNSLTDCAAPCSVNGATTSFDRDSKSRLHRGGSDPLQSPALTDMMESDSEDQDAAPDATEESSRSAEPAKRAEAPEKERTRSTEERSVARRENLDLMKQMAQMVESTQISIKVKLVRTQGEVWEVAKMQNTETLSVLSSLEQATLHSDSESSSLQSSPASKPDTLSHNAALIQSGRPCLEEVCPVQVPAERQGRRDTHDAAGGGGRVDHQNCCTQVSLCSTGTDQTQSSSFGLSSQQHDAPESFTGQREPTSRTHTQAAESLICSFAVSPALGPVTPTQSVCRGLSTQDKEDDRERLPSAGRNSEQSSPSDSQSAIDDLHLPRFISPLKPAASAGKPKLLFRGARPCCYRTGLNLDPVGRRRLAESLNTPPRWSSQMHVKHVKRRQRTKSSVGDDHQTTSEDEPRGGIAAQEGCKPTSLRHLKEAYVWRVRDGVQTHIHLNACSVSLSSNNVLAKERKLAISSSGESKGTQNVSKASSKIQTRGFLKKIQEASCQSKVRDCSTSKAAVGMSDAVDRGEVAPIKRKRGRPFSKKGPPKQIAAGASDRVKREQKSDRYVALGDGGGIKTKRKRRRKTQVAAVPEKRTRRAGKADLGDNRDVATKRSSSKRPRKMKRRFAQRTKSMVMSVKGNKDKGVNEAGRHEKSSDYKVIEDEDDAENRNFFTPALDENSNEPHNTQDHSGNSCTFSGDAVSLLGDELQGDISGEEVGLLHAKTTELLQNLGEAQRSGSCQAMQNNTLPQGDKSLSDCNPNPKHTVLSSRLPHQVPFNGPWQHEQVDVEGVEEEEGEEEEEEIEVVLYSPVLQHRVWENILDNMDMLQARRDDDDDDDEDLSEIDVTGDEAE